MRDVREDWELGRVYLPQDELAAYGVAEDDIAAGRAGPEWRRADGVPGLARARRTWTRGSGCSSRSTARSARLRLRPSPGLYRATLDRIESRGFDVFDGVGSALVADEAADHGRGAAAMRVAVVGGGLAGLSAALELVDGGHEVTLHEARPTLGGAVQTLPRREGDPEPPPDNGQHIALGCFTEYLRFLERDRRARLGAARAARRCRCSTSAAAAPRSRRRRSRCCATGTSRSATGCGSCARSRAGATRGATTFADALRARGQSQRAIDRFWDVFIRPALNLRSEEASADAGDFTVRTALLGEQAATPTCCCRRGRSARCTATPPGGRSRPRARRCSGTSRASRASTELDADAIVVAVPPRESARLLGEPEPQLEDSPIVSVHLWFDRVLLDSPLAALLGSDAHWVFDRGAADAARRRSAAST